MAPKYVSEIYSNLFRKPFAVLHRAVWELLEEVDFPSGSFIDIED